MEEKYVQKITLAVEADRKVAYATVKIGDITIRGINVWRGGNGRLRVNLPAHTMYGSFIDSVELPSELRSEIEAEVIARYRAESKKTAQEGPNAQ